MAFRVTESLEVKLRKRVRILSDVFVGCQITNGEEDGLGAQILKIRSQVSARRKMIAYIEYSTDRENAKDEFHIVFPEVEPLVAVAMERFEETDVMKLERTMPDLIAVAHYERKVNTRPDTSALQDDKYGGRTDACLEILRTLEES